MAAIGDIAPIHALRNRVIFTTPIAARGRRKVSAATVIINHPSSE